MAFVWAAFARTTRRVQLTELGERLLPRIVDVAQLPTELWSRSKEWIATCHLATIAQMCVVPARSSPWLFAAPAQVENAMPSPATLTAALLVSLAGLASTVSASAGEDALGDVSVGQDASRAGMVQLSSDKWGMPYSLFGMNGVLTAKTCPSGRIRHLRFEVPRFVGVERGKMYSEYFSRAARSTPAEWDAVNLESMQQGMTHVSEIFIREMERDGYTFYEPLGEEPRMAGLKFSALGRKGSEERLFGVVVDVQHRSLGRVYAFIETPKMQCRDLRMEAIERMFEEAWVAPEPAPEPASPWGEPPG